MTAKRLDSGLIIVTEEKGTDYALLMLRSDAMRTKECMVTCVGSSSPSDPAKVVSKMDDRFLPLMRNACAFFGNEFGHELVKALGRAEVVVDRETDEFHLQLFALRYQVPRDLWSGRVVPVTAAIPIRVRKGDDADLDICPDDIVMDENGKEAVAKAFLLPARRKAS